MRLKLTSSQFADFVSTFFYDRLTNENVVPYQVNEEFDDLIEVLRRKGCRQVFLAYYLRMNPQIRVKYRMGRSTFELGKGRGSLLLEIVPDEIPVEMKPVGIIKKVGRLLKKFLTGEFTEEETKKRM
jgi:hypothetical protein